MRPPNILSACVIALALAVTGCKALDSSSTTPAPAAAPATSKAPATKAPATSRPSAAPTTSSAAPAKTTPAATAKKADPSAACENRKWSGNIYVRFISPGSPWNAQELGNEWFWDNTTGKCLDGVQTQMASAPLIAGACTQVGYVKDNPNYDVNATPAPPLADVAAQAGPACP